MMLAAVEWARHLRIEGRFADLAHFLEGGGLQKSFPQHQWNQPAARETPAAL